MALNRIVMWLPWVVMTVVAGCGRGDDKNIKIGGIAPLTGEAAATGLSGRRGTELAVEVWNGRGGLLGKGVKLVFCDDRGDPVEGATAVTKLIERDRVAGIVGATMSKVTLAGAPIAQMAHVPMISPVSTNPKVTEVGDYVFRACFTDAFQGRAGAQFAIAEMKLDAAACLFDLGNDYSKGLAEIFKATFQELGGRVVAFDGYAAGNIDFRAQITKILHAQPKLIYLPCYYGDVALQARQIRDLGFTGPLLGTDGWDSPALLALGDSVLKPCFYTTHFSKDDPRPEVRSFINAYQARFGVGPDVYAALAYDATNILLEAIHKAGTTNGSAVRDAMAATDLQVVTGRVRFDAQRNPIKQLVAIEITEDRRVRSRAFLPRPLLD